MTRITAAIAALILIATPALAIDYHSDPVYKPLNSEDHHPMEDMVMLAEQGDARAQFILGDLFAKGKGGFGKDIKKARHWFETSARNGYSFSFIRLAALEKRAKRPVAAYKWYTLAIETLYGKSRDWAHDARDHLADDNKLTAEEISRAKQELAAWKRNEQPETETETKKPAAKETPKETIAPERKEY
jgi:TPR repeat protein